MTALSRIAEASRSVPQVRNKALAFKAVCEIIKNLTEDQENELHGELARLYAAFQPTVPKKPKTMFDWVAKAMAKNDVRYYLNFVHVTEERMVGTDGHRLHIAPNTDGLEPGFYDKNGTKLHNPDYARFPDVDRVMPTNLDSYGRKIVEAKLSEIGEGAFTSDKGVFNYYRFPLQDNFVAFNKKYVHDMLSMEDPDAVLQWSIADANQVVVVANLSDGRQACVMPMRV